MERLGFFQPVLFILRNLQKRPDKVPSDTDCNCLKFPEYLCYIKTISAVFGFLKD
jgi:hypothetical protein